MQQHSGRVKSETDRLSSSASRTMDGSSMVRLALDAQTASQSGPTYCLKKIIPRSPQLAAAGSLQKTWAPPSVAAAHFAPKCSALLLFVD